MLQFTHSISETTRAARIGAEPEECKECCISERTALGPGSSFLAAARLKCGDNVGGVLHTLQGYGAKEGAGFKCLVPRGESPSACRRNDQPPFASLPNEIRC